MQTLDLGLCLHCVVTNLIHFSRGLDMLGHIIKILFLITILFWISTAETTLTAVLSAAVTPTEVSPTEVLPTWKPATSIKVFCKLSSSMQEIAVGLQKENALGISSENRVEDI